MTPSVSTAADVLAVTATICRLVPSATVWREPDIICWPLASITVRTTEAGKRTATHTVTDRVVTCRSTGPASQAPPLPHPNFAQLEGGGRDDPPELGFRRAALAQALAFIRKTMGKSPLLANATTPRNSCA